MESDHGGRAAKPCRACTDFKSFMKTGPATPEKAKKPSKTPKVPQKPCPPDVNEIGRGSWTLLHTMSAYLPEGAVHKRRRIKDFIIFINFLHFQDIPYKNCPKDRQKWTWFC